MKLCKECNYPRMAGQAFTDSKCRVCGKHIWNLDTDVNIVCEECSNTKNLCVKCGKEIKDEE